MVKYITKINSKTKLDKQFQANLSGNGENKPKVKLLLDNKSKW